MFAGEIRQTGSERQENFGRLLDLGDVRCGGIRGSGGSGYRARGKHGVRRRKQREERGESRNVTGEFK